MARIFDVVEYPSDMSDELIHVFPESGIAEFRAGTQIIVRQGQNVVLRDHGQISATFPPGRHIISTDTVPALKKGFVAALRSFPAEAVFIRVSTLHDIKWGTPASFLVGGANSPSKAFISAFGNFSFSINDPKVFLEQFEGDIRNSVLKSILIEDRIRAMVFPKISQAVEEVTLKVPAHVLDILSNHKKEISERMRALAAEECSSLGITLREVSFVGFNVTKDSAKLLEAWNLTHSPSPLMISEAPDPTLIFVIMSFQEDMEPVFKTIAAAAKAVGLVAKRVKDVPGDYRITEQIIKMIHSARFVVVDLTYERPNVYFELGYARGLQKKVVTLAKEGTNVHFDVKDWAYIPYSKLRKLGSDLKKRFKHDLAEDEPADRSDLKDLSKNELAKDTLIGNGGSFED